MASSRTKMMQATTSENEGNFAAQDWVLFVSISLIWGASFLLMAESLEAFTPGVVTLGRVGLGAVALWAIRLARQRTTGPVRLDREDRRPVAVLALVWVAVPFTLFPIAQQWINSAVTGLLKGATPVFVALISAVFLRVAPTGRQAVGLVLGFAGILLISLASAGEGASQARGVLLVLVATLCYGFAFNMASPLQAKYGGIVLMSNVLLVASVANIPYALVDLGENEWQVSSAVALATVGIVGTGIAYWIMASLVGRVGSLRSSLITYLIPIVSLVLGIVFRDDDVGSLALIGAPVTIVGAFLASRRSAP